MLQKDLNVILRIRNSVFCPSSPETGSCNTVEGVRYVLRETKMWEMAEGAAGASHECIFFLPILNLGAPRFESGSATY